MPAIVDEAVQSGSIIMSEPRRMSTIEQNPYSPFSPPTASPEPSSPEPKIRDPEAEAEVKKKLGLDM